MNDEQVQNEVNALTGGSANQPADTTDWKTKYAELERQYQSAKVEEGRVRKLDEQLKERDRKIAELEAKRAGDDLGATLTAEDREKIPAEVLDAATKLVSGGLARQRAETEARFQELERRNQANAEAQKAENGRRFLSLVDAKFPGFRSSVGTGGDKAEAWSSYLRYNRGSIDAALTAGDFDTFAYHVEKFYTDHLGIPVPSGEQNGSAASDPRSSGGGNGGGKTVSGKVYTQEEFEKLYDLIEVARDKGDWAEKARLEAELKAAPAEGRVQG